MLVFEMGLVIEKLMPRRVRLRAEMHLLRPALGSSLVIQVGKLNSARRRVSAGEAESEGRCRGQTVVGFEV
jgi:hypothetical protein